MARRLYRSRTERMIWGVCGGLASYFDVDPTIIRIAAILAVFLNGLGIVAYIVMALVVPLEASAAAEPKDVIRENVEEMRTTASKIGQQIRSGLARQERRTMASPSRTLTVLAVIIIIVGVIFLLANFRIFWWLQWGFLWPLMLIAIGVLILLSRRR